MGKIYENISPEVAAWVARQPLFFVATAPVSSEGHVNCSPKGLDTFRVLDPFTVAYADLTGSGAETAAHLRENGRIVLMFCAFEGPPKIVRFHGQGEVIVDLVGDRDVIDRWVETKGRDNLPAYRKEKNARSIDGLPAADFDG